MLIFQVLEIIASFKVGVFFFRSQEIDFYCGYKLRYVKILVVGNRVFFRLRFFFREGDLRRINVELDLDKIIIKNKKFFN